MLKKKILLFCLILSFIFIIFSCTEPWVPYELAPPAWILGTWSDIADINTYIFSSDNVIFTALGTTIDFQEFNNDSTGPENTIIDTIIDSTTYNIEITNSGISNQVLFEQTSSTTLDYTLEGEATIELIKK